MSTNTTAESYSIARELELARRNVIRAKVDLSQATTKRAKRDANEDIEFWSNKIAYLSNVKGRPMSNPADTIKTNKAGMVAAMAYAEEAQHTPGPWRYEATGCVFSSTLLIAECPMNKLRTVPDARLIAAAPEMLEALRQMVDASVRGDQRAVRAIGIAAIAKASGA